MARLLVAARPGRPGGTAGPPNSLSARRADLRPWEEGCANSTARRVIDFHGCALKTVRCAARAPSSRMIPCKDRNYDTHQDFGAAVRRCGSGLRYRRGEGNVWIKAGRDGAREVGGGW